MIDNEKDEFYNFYTFENEKENNTSSMNENIKDDNSSADLSNRSINSDIQFSDKIVDGYVVMNENYKDIPDVSNTANIKKRRIVAAALSAVFVILAICGVLVALKESDNGTSGIANTLAGKKEDSYTVESTSVTDGNIKQISNVSDIVSNVLPSIVAITETSLVTNYYFGGVYSDEVSGSGSGIIIDENNDEYLIVTNNHVIDGANSITITFVNKKTAEATVKATDSSEDLAIVSVKKKNIDEETKKAIKIATMGDSSNLRVGDNVIAIGNALGYGISVTSGYISAKDREITIDSLKMTVLQTDAAINPGNSGGALINIDGEVIGINSAKLSSQEVEGMGYAIPVSEATPIIDELKTKEELADGDKGFLGIVGQNVTDEISENSGFPVGVYVDTVIEGGGAKKSGIIEGDIVVKFDGKEITTIEQLKEKVSSYKKGSTVDVVIMRAEDGVFKEKTISVTLTETLSDSTSTDSNTQKDNQSNGFH